RYRAGYFHIRAQPQRYPRAGVGQAPRSCCGSTRRRRWREAARACRSADPGSGKEGRPHPGDAYHHRPDALRRAGAGAGARMSTDHALVERLSKARVLVLGDVMLDRYVYGVVDRMSPEAPVPVLRQESQRAMAGGAGNVARNVAAFGGKVV